MAIMQIDATTQVQCLALVVHTLIILKGGVTASSHSSSGLPLSPSSAPQPSSTAQSPAVTASSQSSSESSFPPSVTPHSSSTAQPSGVTASTQSSPGVLPSPSTTPQLSTTAQSPAVTASSQSSSESSFPPSVTPQSSSPAQPPGVTASTQSSPGVILSSSTTPQPSSTAQIPAVKASSQSSSESSFSPSVTPLSSSTAQPPGVTASTQSSPGVLLSSSTTSQPSSTAQSPAVTASSQSSSESSFPPSVTPRSPSTAQPSGVTPSTQSSPGALLSSSTTPQPSSTAQSSGVTASSQSSSGSSFSPSLTPQSLSTPKPSAPNLPFLRISPSPSGSVSRDVTSTVATDPTSLLLETKPSPSPTRFLLPSSSVTAIYSSKQYVKIYFSMPWGRFCYLRSLFKESLSRKLLEFKGVQWHYVPLKRIRLYNAKEKCSNRTLYHTIDAILELFITKTEGQRPNNTDIKMTKKAFHLLYGYWTNKRMILLDQVFEGKVSKVVYVGPESEPKPKKDRYTANEAPHIGIAIGVALAVVAFILIVTYLVRGYRAVRQAGRKKDDEKMVFTNEHAFEENSRQLESQPQTPEEPQQVVVHSEPSPPQTEKSESVANVEDTAPLLSMIKDYEDGKKDDEPKSDKETDETDEPLAKPESGDSEGKPIKPPRSDSMIDADIVIPEQTLPISEVPVTDEKVKNEEEGTEPDETEEEGKEKRSPTFTSSVTINITPEATTFSKEFDYRETEQPPAPEKEDSSQAATGGGATADEIAKPDFGQSDSGDFDPNEGAINLGFDEDETPKKEKKEETKF